MFKVKRISGDWHAEVKATPVSGTMILRVRRSRLHADSTFWRRRPPR